MKNEKLPIGSRRVNMYGLIIILIYPIIIGCLLFIYFTTLIKSQINKNFVVLLEYFLKREAITAWSKF